MGKWSSNVRDLLPGPDDPQSAQSLPQDGNLYVKILGLVWSPAEDFFSFSVHSPLRTATKRVILSHVARIFDPLGFLAPIIFLAKALLQEIWRNNLDWDDPLPETLHAGWAALTDEWSSLATIRIPRYIFAARSQFQLIGFSDASSRGYAAAAYIRVSTLEGPIHSYLLKSKTKVAPSKFKSIAQLELCGALLLQRVMTSITIEASLPPLYYTDSAVVLAWLRTPM